MVMHPTTSPHNDGLLRWLECLVARVEDGTYAVRPIIPDVEVEVEGDEEQPNTMGLNLFPLKPTWEGVNGVSDYSRAVTRGVEVCASALFMPEMGQWTYSLSVRILPPGDPEYQSPEARGFTTCQVCPPLLLCASALLVLALVRGAGIVVESARFVMVLSLVLPLAPCVSTCLHRVPTRSSAVKTCFAVPNKMRPSVSHGTV